MLMLRCWRRLCGGVSLGGGVQTWQPMVEEMKSPTFHRLWIQLARWKLTGASLETGAMKSAAIIYLR